MIRRYRVGNPMNTEAVVQELPFETGDLPGWQMDPESRTLSRDMSEDMVVYGLGETVRGINKRGWLYISNCTDDPNHTEDKHSLYASQNFLLITEKGQCTGLFIDTPGKVTFDIGYTKYDRLVITFEDFDADLYLIGAETPPQTGAETPRQVVSELRRLTGKSYLPPKGALGFGQSRWSYLTADEVREVARQYRLAGIPLDSIYLDIDYMDHYKDFTVNEEAFPDFPGFVSEMKEEGIHLVPIIDAGVKIEEGYPVYEEGVQNGYFCRKENGEYLTAAVWPGKVHFPDFLNEDARKWFGDWYAFLLDQGIEGFWNDMNEPAIFYTEDHLKEVFEQLDGMKGKNLDLSAYSEFQELTGTVSNNPEDYRRFYHNFHGEKVRHDKVHNLYGYYMPRAAGEAFARLCPDKQILMFSRASYIGMHRYGGVWTGDNKSWWSHVLLNLQQMPALNMCGFLFSGADIGGFGADATEDLLIRWLQLGIFMPLFRDHSAMGTRRQELYRFDRIPAFRSLIRLRYALIPYLYEELQKAAETDGMLIAPLAFDYPEDSRCAEIEDQLLVGPDLMIAPVWQQNKKGRMVYLPEAMKLLRFRSPGDYTEEILEAGDHYIPYGLDEAVFFLRKGGTLKLADFRDEEEICSTLDLENRGVRIISF